MSLRAWIFTLTAAVLISVGVATTAAVWASPDTAPRTGKISLTAVEVEHHSQGSFAGATETWAFRLTSIRRNPQRPFGYMILACTRIWSTVTLRQCTGTASLPLGKLTLNGSFLYLTVFEFAVTGGTDTYDGAAGIVTMAQLPHTSNAFSLMFSLQ